MATGWSSSITRKRAWVAACCLAFAAGCDGGSQQVLSLQQCAALSFSGPMTVTIGPGATAGAIAISGPDSAITGLDITRSPDDSRVAFAGVEAVDVQITCAPGHTLVIVGLQRARVAATGVAVARLGAYGDSVVRFEGSSDELDARASGAAELVVTVEAGTITVLASGKARVSLTGAADELVVHAGGTAMVAAGELRAQDVSVRAAGDSDVLVWPSAHLRTSERDNSTVRSRGDISAEPL